jgi:hypothetical protein
MESHGNIMGISWEYYGEIKEISISSRIHIYLSICIFIYIYMRIHIYIYTYFGISWISIEMIKLHKAVIKPSHPPKSGLCH